MPTPAITTIDCTETVNAIVAQHPATLRVFDAFGIDTCCGGAKSVEEVVQRHGIHAATLCAALVEAIDGAAA
jgi:regulator of cell morphogenesis and NO signaling